MNRSLVCSRSSVAFTRLALCAALIAAVVLPFGTPPTVAAAEPAAVWGWGDNSYGQLGDDSGESLQDAPVQVLNLADAVAVAGGMGHSMALLPDGTVWAWGYNSYGQLGDDSTTERPTPVQVSGLTDAAAIACGEEHSVAVKSDGTVWAWGWNEYGQLGDGSNDNSDIPVQVTGLSNVVAVAAGFYHSLALKADGTVWSWGGNGYGQLGDNSSSPSNVPVQVSDLTNVVAIACGGEYSLALLSDGTMMAWGANGSYQLGDCVYPWEHRYAPVAVGGGVSDVIAIAAGAWHTLAVKADGTVWAWGYNEYGQAGDPILYEHNTWKPDQVSGLSDVVSVAGGHHHSMALKSDGTVWTWGRNLQGQLGDASTTDSSTPVQVSGLSGVTTIASGWFHSLAVKSERPLGAWGYNDSGQLGDDSTDNRAVPVPVSGLSDLTAVSGGELHSLALRAHGTVWAWGDNYSGQLGNGSTDSSEVPVQVNGLTDVKAVAAGSRHSLALKSDGTVWGWGLNETSIWQLGTGSAGNQDTPVQVGSLEGVTAIAAGAQHGLALLANGTVWGWGANNYGQLGDGSYDNRSTPVQVMTAGLVDPLTDVAAIACGIGFSLALRSDGTVWAWGDDQYGQLGNGAAGSSPTPVQVTELPLTRAIAGGAYHCLAVQADGTVRAWGDNWYGQLGDGSSGDGTNKNAPVQVTGLTGATGVAGGVTHSLALLSDGTVRAWGWNSEGQLGDDSGSNSTAPVAVANVTSVTTVAAGWRHSLATGAMEGGPTTEEVSLVLTAGWNMVSVPVVPADTSRAAVFPPADVVAVYTWNPSQKSYDVPTNIAPEVGYWVAVTENKTITVTGTPMTTWPSSLITGWNMVGSVYGTAVSVNDLEAFAVDPSGSVLTNAIYWWDPEGKSYVAETSIVKGQGYWMAATADCTLTMTAPV